ncbi:hypothetical protein HYC85_000339 [Camellia sinensis]|uniref:ADP,ATP carrier protein n=1 Tax=Camellia sinensis TaxID=4442 RepID=A0A7J7I269_CAMSI|nr:hypothetical protein HYC85_000339 [Camellia sinensis]
MKKRDLKKVARHFRISKEFQLYSGIKNKFLRTFVAPLERLKLEYMKNLFEVIKAIAASQGLKGFWKGTFVNILCTASFKAANFYAYDTYRNQLLRMFGNEETTNFERFRASATAGITATMLCIPMDTQQPEANQQLEQKQQADCQEEQQWLEQNQSDQKQLDLVNVVRSETVVNLVTVGIELEQDLVFVTVLKCGTGIELEQENLQMEQTRKMRCGKGIKPISKRQGRVMHKSNSSLYEMSMFPLCDSILSRLDEFEALKSGKKKCPICTNTLMLSDSIFHRSDKSLEKNEDEDEKMKMVAPGGEALGGVIGAFRYMIQNEGCFSLYKGLVPLNYKHGTFSLSAFTRRKEKNSTHERISKGT